MFVRCHSKSKLTIVKIMLTSKITYKVIRTQAQKRFGTCVIFYVCRGNKLTRWNRSWTMYANQLTSIHGFGNSLFISNKFALTRWQAGKKYKKICFSPGAATIFFLFLLSFPYLFASSFQKWLFDNSLPALFVHTRLPCASPLISLLSAPTPVSLELLLFLHTF